MIPLDIYSDPICPWCLIGKTRLDRAIARRAEAGAPPLLTAAWRPFQLNPTMPREGMDRRLYLERKFGGPEGAARVYGPIEATAKAEGLDVRFDRIRRTPNTLDAHRLIHWAGLEGAQAPVVDALFARYFTQGEDISEAGVLADIAHEAGLDRAAISRLLAGDADSDSVRAEDTAARDAGLSGVPAFVIARRHVVPGAIETAAWARILDELTG